MQRFNTRRYQKCHRTAPLDSYGQVLDYYYFFNNSKYYPEGVLKLRKYKVIVIIIISIILRPTGDSFSWAWKIKQSG